MREILFKAKRVDGKGWVEGDYFYNFNDSMHIILEVIHDSGSMDEPPSDYMQENNVIPETVCQFIGIIDKNGKEIFRGDICRCNSVDYVVVWETGKAPELYLNGEHYGFLFRNNKKVDVIGNIHD